MSSQPLGHMGSFNHSANVPGVQGSVLGTKEAGPGAALPASSPLAQSALYRSPATPGPQMPGALHRCQSSYSSPVNNSPRAVQRWFS